MSLYGDVRKGVRKVALSALSSEFPTAEIIFSHVGGAEPSNPYVVVNILALEQMGRHSTSTLTNVGEELSIRTFYELRVQFTFCGSTAGDMAQHFTQRIGNNPVVIEETSRNKLGYMRKGSVQRLPIKRETQWVEYFTQDVTFNYIVNTQQIVDVVESVLLEDAISGDIFTIPPGISIP